MIVSRQFLVTHGRHAALSRCAAPESKSLNRDELGVVRTPRGLELAIVLSEATTPAPELATVEWLRHATDHDRRRAEVQHHRATALLDDAVERGGHLPLLVVDAEWLLDDSLAFLHIIRWGDATLTPLLEQLQVIHGVRVAAYDLSSHPDAKGGCGSCGDGCDSCGTGGCSSGGCGDGGCSRGSRPDADALAARFRRLREQMETLARVPLH
jgi:hypothetical protein